jgi:hypothetical protein
MKKLFLVVFFLTSLFAFSQEAETPNYIVKTDLGNLIGLSIQKASLSLEKTLHSSNSKPDHKIQPTLNFTLAIPLEVHADFNIEQAAEVSSQIRLYFINNPVNKLNATYIGLNLVGNYTNVSRIDEIRTDCIDYNNCMTCVSCTDVERNYLQTGMGLNTLVGRQQFFGKHFTLDVNAGLGIYTSNVNPTELELAADQQVFSPGLVPERNPSLQRFQRGTGIHLNIPFSFNIGYAF